MNNLEKFNPLKAEVQTVVDNCKNSVISMPDGKTGLELMKENKRILQKKRKDVVDFLKEERASAIAYQKTVIQFEKDILAIIEPVEDDLTEKIKKIEEEEARAQRAELLPERKDKLNAINCNLSDDELLDMDEKAFATFYLAKKDEYLVEKENQIKAEQEEKERKFQEEQDKLEAEKRKLEEDKRVEEAKKQAEKEAQEKAIKDAKIAKLKAEEDRIKAVQEAEAKAEREKKEALAKAEAEKQAIIDANNLKEQERLAEEQRLKDLEIARKQAEKEEAEKLEKRKKYQNFLAKNGRTEENKNDFIINRNGNEFILYKKVDSIIIK